MSRRLRPVCAAAAAMLVALAAAAPASATDQAVVAIGPAAEVSHLQILNYRIWVKSGKLYIFGEIRNTSSKRVNPWVSAMISPGPTAPRQMVSSTITVPSLAPGARGAFAIIVSPFAPTSTRVTAMAAGGYVVEQPAAAVGTSVVRLTSHVDPEDPGVATSSAEYEVRNTTGRPIRIIDVTGGFRGTDGRISVTAGGQLSTPIEVAAGATYRGTLPAYGPATVAVSANIQVLAVFADGAGEHVVTWTNWFHDTGSHSLLSSIAWLAEAKITGGCGGMNFCPDSPVTRVQMAMFLDRALKLAPTSVDYFTDDNGITGEASINRLAAAGITGGCGGGSKFCPRSAVTRAQMAMFLDRAFRLPGTRTNYFTDDNGITGEASINRLAAAGITGGCGGTKYCPASPVLRAQIAAFLKRALN